MESDLRSFLSATSTLLSSSSSISSFRAPVTQGLRLASSCPSAVRDALLQLIGMLADVATEMHFSKAKERRQAAEMVERAGKRISAMVEANPAYWAAHTATWSMTVLGDVSAKYASRIKSGSGSGSSLSEALPAWLACPPTRVLIDLSTQCLEAVVADDDKTTERCISVLLDLSVRLEAKFDWVVAHVGGGFPETVITRVLAVGLKDFCAHAETQVKRDKSFNVARVPKINSVVGILGHLAATHRTEIRDALHTMVAESLDVPEKAQTAQDVATVPYVLYLASLSDSLSSTLADGIYDMVTIDLADRVADLIEVWEERYFPEEASLVNLAVGLVLSSADLAGKDLVRLLLDLGAELNRDVPREVRSGCRLVLDLIIADLQNFVHNPGQTSPGGKSGASNEDPSFASSPLLESLGTHAEYFMENYLLVKDSYHRRCTVSMLAYLSLHPAIGGRPVAVKVVKHCLLNADTEEELGLMFEFIKDTELWVPGVVPAAVASCLRAKVGVSKQATLLDNLATILQHQSSDAADHKLKLVSQFSRSVSDHQIELLAKLAHRQLVPKVLKIFHFVPLQVQHGSVAQDKRSYPLVHNASHCLVHTVFMLLEDNSGGGRSAANGSEGNGKGQNDDDEDGEESLNLMLSQCVRLLLDVASHPAGMPMVLRFLVEGAINSKFAELFGGKWRGGLGIGPKTKPPPAAQKSVSLLEENLKFGSMPTHPLGSAAAFHAGTIGEGKRLREPPSPYSRLGRNSFTETMASDPKRFSLFQRDGGLQPVRIGHRAF